MKRFLPQLLYVRTYTRVRTHTHTHTPRYWWHIFLVTSAGGYIIDAYELSLNREDLEERIDEHQKECRVKKCETCDNLEEDEERYDRYSLKLILNALQTLALSEVFALILFAFGVLLSNLGGTKKKNGYVPAYVAPVPTVACPNCGKEKKDTDLFCGNCGTIFEN